MLKFSRHLMLIALVCFFAMPVLAQTATHIKKKPVVKAVPMPPNQFKMITKAWRLDSLSSFGTTNKAKDTEGNDGITFIADSSFFFTQEGIPAMGKWMYVAPANINAVTTNPDKKFSFKIVSITDSRLILDYQFPAPDLTRVRYIYTPKEAKNNTVTTETDKTN